MQSLHSSNIRFVVVLLGSLLSSTAAPASDTPPSGVIKLEVSPEHQSTPIWLTILDRLAWPTVVAAAIIVFRKPAATVIEAFAKPGAEGSIAGFSWRLPALETKIADQQGQLERQNRLIKQLITFSMAWYIYEMLHALNAAKKSGGQYLFRQNGSMDRNLRFLIDHGYIQEVFPIPSDGADIARDIKITQAGLDLIEMRGAP
jgi:hypothetical protein